MDSESAGRITALFQNPVFLSAVISLFVAQFAKVVISLYKGRSTSFRELAAHLLWRTGGMPSSHSALVISIVTAIGFSDGPGSDIFVLALAFALVVIRDALGVRRAAGMQATALNILGRQASRKLKIPFKPVKEVHGHTVPQVIVGSFMGFFIGLAVCTL